MKRYIDIDSWNRREHFLHFNSFDDPFFGVTVDVDFTAIYKKTKEEKGSLFLDILFEIMRAANNTESFRFRIEGNRIVCFDTLMPSTTVGREDGTYGICMFDYSPIKLVFLENGKLAVEHVKSCTGLMLTDDMKRDDTIHYSPVPWFRFTDMKHPTTAGRTDSVPKISTGKLYKAGDAMLLPISITVNHALMDGRHVALFLEELNNQIAAT